MSRPPLSRVPPELWQILNFQSILKQLILYRCPVSLQILEFKIKVRDAKMGFTVFLFFCYRNSWFILFNIFFALIYIYIFNRFSSELWSSFSLDYFIFFHNSPLFFYLSALRFYFLFLEIYTKLLFYYSNYYCMLLSQ